MDEIHEQKQQRIQKMEALKALGIDPYGEPFEADHNTEEVFSQFGSLSKESLENEKIRVRMAGRIIMIRDFGRAAFVHIQDSSGRIQIYLRKNVLGEQFAIMRHIDIGDFIGISGTLFRTKTDELTVEVEDLKFLTKSLQPLPEKWHGLKDIEQRYRQRYLDLIVNPSVKATFTKRSLIIKRTRDFLEQKGFIEVETPMMHQIPGGAAAKPFKTHHNALDIDLYLRIAPELYLKRLLVGGYEKVFELNKNFRNEGISTKHNPEFTMLEFYIAYKDYHFLMNFTEELITYLVNEICGAMTIPFGEETINMTPPWPKIGFYDSLIDKGVPEEILRDRDRAHTWAKEQGFDVKAEDSLGKVLDEIFKEKVEQFLVNPTFIIDYPLELSPLAKKKKGSNDLVDRFELFIASREIANAFSELNDPQDQKERFLKQVEAKEQGDEEAHWMDDDFVRALEHGMPPAAGEGIGIDRLVMLLTNSPSIRDVIMFPQMKPEK